MINPKVDTFLERHNMNYLFLQLANLEVRRLSDLPSTIKDKFDRKLTVTALDHVAENEIPDYIADEPIDLDFEQE